MCPYSHMAYFSGGLDMYVADNMFLFSYNNYYRVRLGTEANAVAVAVAYLC